jgi:tRNA1(Val) A37 N6-methylase TrmN6
MVFLSFNVCNPAFYNANDQNQNLRETRLFKTLIQKCSRLDALIKSLTTMLSKMGQKTLLHFLFHKRASKKWI